MGADDGRRTVDLTEVGERDLGRGALAGVVGEGAGQAGLYLGARVLTVKSMFPAVYLYGHMVLGWAWGGWVFVAQLTIEGPLGSSCRARLCRGVLWCGGRVAVSGEESRLWQAQVPTSVSED